jgi:hypothetical protein
MHEEQPDQHDEDEGASGHGPQRPCPAPHLSNAFLADPTMSGI